MQFLPGPVHVRAPATSANLGPGFDALGLALARYDRVTARIADGPTYVEVGGEGAGEVHDGEDHLVVRTMRRTFDAIAELTGSGRERPGLRLRCANAIPHGRGLGSSAAAIVSGILAARALVAGGPEVFPEERVFALATAIEGHPDNVAPCVTGGVATGWTEDGGNGRTILLRFDTHPSVAPVACIPSNRLSTEAARGLLPATVPFGDAAANAARAALLLPALTTRPDLLFDATEDRLHQVYRAAAMPDSYELMTRLRKSGVPAVISGAGPTVLAFGDPADVDSVAAEMGMDWAIRPLDVDRDGACVLPSETP